MNLGSKLTVPAPEENADEHVAKATAMQAFATAVGGLSPSKVAAYFMGYGAGGGQKFHNAGNKGQPNPGNKGQPNRQETGTSTSQRQQGFANGKWDPKSKNRIRNRKYPTAAVVELHNCPVIVRGWKLKRCRCKDSSRLLRGTEINFDRRILQPIWQLASILTTS